MNGRLELRLLGPPLVVWQGEPFVLLRRQARSLLYYLAHDLLPASREQLLYMWWPDVAPAEARRNLTRLISYIRQELPHHELIQYSPDAITLNAQLAGSDTALFSRLVAEADPIALSNAIALYRGDFLAGFFLPENAEYEAWLAGQQRCYERGYLNALAKLVATETAAGNLESAIAYTRQYLATDELAEEAHRRLIILYNQTGNRCAARRQFEQCTIILERELGVTPMPETRAACEAASLRTPGTAPLARPTSEQSWRTLPSLNLPLVGREDAWRHVVGAYHRFVGGGVIFITGEPGVGKSRLMKEFALAQQAQLLVGHSDMHPLPFGPLVEALRPVLSHEALKERVRPIWLAELSRLLPELLTLFPHLPSPVAVEPQHAQLRLFEALAQVVLGLAHHGRLLLCLDDVHWADEGTLGWLQYLSGRLDGSGLRILATYRAQNARNLLPWQRELERARLVEIVELRGLSSSAIAAVLRQVSDVADLGPLPRRIRAATGGNAFFVLEIVRELLETGCLTAGVRQLPLPKSLQDTVLRRAGRLDPLAQQVLEIAAVLSPRLEMATLVEASGASPLQVAGGLQALVSGQLLQESRGRFRFHHELARDAVYQQIQPWRRRLLHSRAAGALTRQPGAGSSCPAAIARHYIAAGDAPQAIAYYHEAALQAQQSFAYDEAIRYLHRAIQLLPAAAGDDVRLTLYELLGASFQSCGKFEKAREAFAAALACLPPTAIVRRANLLKLQAASFIAQHRLDDAEATLDDALGLLASVSGDHSSGWQHVWLELQLQRMAVYYYQQRSPQQRDAVANEVGAILDQVGSLEQHSAYQRLLLDNAFLQDRFRILPERTKVAQALLSASLETGHPGKIARAHFLKGFCALWSNNGAGAVEPLSACLALAEEGGLFMDEILSRTYLAYAYRLRANLVQTRQHARACLRLAREGAMMSYVGVAESHLAWLAWREGRLDEAAARAGSAVELWTSVAFPFQWAAHWVLLVLAFRGNDLSQGCAAARAMLDLGQQRLPDDVTGALEAVVAVGESGVEESARIVLERAVVLAQEHGYL